MGEQVVNVNKIPKCRGARNAVVLYGGSGAGKTKNTIALMSGLDKIFPSDELKRSLSITEIITVGMKKKNSITKKYYDYYTGDKKTYKGLAKEIDIGAIDLMKESAPTSCAPSSRCQSL